MIFFIVQRHSRWSLVILVICNVNTVRAISSLRDVICGGDRQFLVPQRKLQVCLNVKFAFPGILNLAGLVCTSTLTVIQREDLVGQHICETADKTRNVLGGAAGGTLLIDDAYRLVPQDSRRDFGPEAMDTIMATIEESSATTSERPAFIFAGTCTVPVPVSVP